MWRKTVNKLSLQRHILMSIGLKMANMYINLFLKPSKNTKITYKFKNKFGKTSCK